MADHTAANLELLRQESDKLLATVRGLSSPEMSAETLCDDWDRAHLLTHVARNADALLNLVRWAVDGQERQAYESDEVRDRDIAEGAARPTEEIIKDVVASAERFRDEAQQLLGPAGEATVRTRTGNEVTGAQVIPMRIIEVVFHHVDLRTGYTFDDADPAWALRNLKRGVRQWESTGAPDLTLLPEGMEPLTLGDGGTEVRGTVGGLLLWVARGDESGVTSEADLPTPPPWA